MKLTAALLALTLLAAPTRAEDPRIADLGSESYEAREAASAHLRSLGWGAAAVLRPARGHADPEVASRVRVLFEDAVDARLAEFGPLPALSFLWYDPAEQEFGDMTKAHADYHRFAHEGDRDGSVGTRRLVRSWLADGKPEPAVEIALFSLRFNEACATWDSYGDDSGLLPWQRALHRLFEFIERPRGQQWP